MALRQRQDHTHPGYWEGLDKGEHAQKMGILRCAEHLRDGRRIGVYKTGDCFLFFQFAVIGNISIAG